MAHTSSQAQQLTGDGLLCIHYDFLPQSADMEEPGELKLRDNGTASVELMSMVSVVVVFTSHPSYYEPNSLCK